MNEQNRPYFQSSDVTIWNADAREAWQWLPEQSVDAIVTSPPYFGLRDYGVEGQIGLEDDPETYIDGLADLLTGYGERVLKPGGSLWLNLGDTYANRANAGASVGPSFRQDRADVIPPRVSTVATAPYKSLLMIPERVALALIARGWILRNRVVWAKPNGMPESVRDRLATKHEALFHLVRQPRYYYDLDAIRQPPATDYVGATWDERKQRGEPTRHGLAGPAGAAPAVATVFAADPQGVNPGDVWTIPTRAYPEAHFAVFPPELVRRPILATVPVDGTVLDPFFGSGTTALMARRLGRKAVGVELNPDYCALAAARFRQDVLDLAVGE